MAPQAERRIPRLLAISDRRALPGGDLGPWLEALAEAGVDGILLREKDLSDRALLELARVARRILGSGPALLVSGRLDVALAAGADGVHLPADEIPVSPLRRSFPQALIGRSAHRFEEVTAAARDGADYVTFGPVYFTPSKAAFGPPLGVSALRGACAVGIPVLALGGLTIERLSEVAAAGAAGTAAIRLFQGRAAATAAVTAAARLFRREAA